MCCSSATRSRDLLYCVRPELAQSRSGSVVESARPVSEGKRTKSERRSPRSVMEGASQTKHCCKNQCFPGSKSGKV